MSGSGRFKSTTQAVTFHKSKVNIWHGLAAHSCIPSTQEAGAEGW